MILDVDHHLNARQMRSKRSAVHAAPGGSMRPLGRNGDFAFSVAARRSLLNLFEPKQELIFWQRLSAPAEAMAAQLRDDLLQPLGACTFRQQHRLQRAGIVGKRIRQGRHGAIKTRAPLRREHSDEADSLCHRSTGLRRHYRLARGVDAASQDLPTRPRVAPQSDA